MYLQREWKGTVTDWMWNIKKYWKNNNILSRYRYFYDYMTYGYQVNTGTDESKEQAAFVSHVLDIYENSYDFDK